ncbi:MAG: hypothetical protein IJM99_05375, partial [Firmicutes bacterium]|nr:hypothetical protein [Bacillota bacterium]
MNYRKQTRSFMVLFFSVLYFIFSCTVPVLAHSSVSVKINVAKATVANMYYEVLYDGEPITEDVTFDFFDENGDLVMTITTVDGEIFIPNVPYGDYELVLQTNSKVDFDIIIDDDYVLEAHIKKPLDIKPPKGNSGGGEPTIPDSDGDGIPDDVDPEPE